MNVTNKLERNLDWHDVAPVISHVHDMGLHRYMMRWPYEAWLALEEAGHTQSSGDLDRRDIQLKAVSIALLHTEFLQELWLKDCYLPDLFFLEGVTTRPEILEILVGRYESTTDEGQCEGESDEEVFLELYLHHRDQIIAAVLERLGSTESLYNSLIELAKTPEDGEDPFSLCQLGSALDFVTGLVATRHSGAA